MRKVNVLDHGFVRLVDSMGGDLSISRAARVSYDAPPREEDSMLIRYLMKNNHSTPFEAVTMTFEVKAPIFVLRQWHRHRTQSYNELSARYKELPNEFYIPELAQITEQSKDNKQMRTEDQHAEAQLIQDVIRSVSERAFEAYKWLLNDKCPRELARSILPVGTYSHMFCTMNLHNLFHFLRLRLHEHAQYEIRVYAEAMLELVSDVAPCAVGAFKETL